MKILKLVLGVLFAVTATFAGADTFPAKTVTIVVPLSPGSATDTLSRIISTVLSDMWRVPVVVENKPGANGIPATVSVVRAEPDGYTLLASATNHVVNATLYDKLPFDTLADVTPIARIGYTPLILCVTPSLPATNFKELIALAKAKPGKLTYGSAGSGSPTHLAGEMLKTMAGIDVIHVPYKAIAQAQTDLVAGHLDMMFVVPSVAMQQINAGRYRGIGVGTLERLPRMPQLPTLDELGLRGFDNTPWIGLVGPAHVPDAIVNKISDDVMKALAMPDVQKRIAELGLIAAAMPAREFGKFMQTEQVRWGKLVKDSGARAD